MSFDARGLLGHASNEEIHSILRQRSARERTVAMVFIGDRIPVKGGVGLLFNAFLLLLMTQQETVSKIQAALSRQPDELLPPGEEVSTREEPHRWLLASLQVALHCLSSTRCYLPEAVLVRRLLV